MLSHNRALMHCHSLHWNVDCSAPCTLYTVQWYVYSVHMPVLNITLLLLTHPNGVPILLNIYVNSDHLCWIFAIWVFHLQSILYSVAVTSVDSSMHRNDACCVSVSSSAFAWAATICVESSPFGVFTYSRYFKVYTCQCCNITFCIWRIIAFAWAATICVESSPFWLFTSSQFFKVLLRDLHHLELWNILPIIISGWQQIVTSEDLREFKDVKWLMEGYVQWYVYSVHIQVLQYHFLSLTHRNDACVSTLLRFKAVQWADGGVGFYE